MIKSMGTACSSGTMAENTPATGQTESSTALVNMRSLRKVKSNMASGKMAKSCNGSDPTWSRASIMKYRAMHNTFRIVTALTSYHQTAHSKSQTTT